MRWDPNRGRAGPQTERPWDFYYLGSSPVDYRFRRSEREAGINAPQAGASVTRRYTAGTVRIELAGYETIERRVRFEGDPVLLNIRLQEKTE